VRRSVTQTHGSVQPAHVPPPTHSPSTHCPLAHCSLRLHLAPPGLSLAPQAMPGMEASVPPRMAAPISLSALLRERVPLASPLVSSSKVRLAVSWLTCAPFPEGRDTRD